MEQLSGVDLNLLVALDALLAEQSVTKAATRLRLSQPGMSSALRRLRKLFNDPLFVREGSILVPTARALSLAEPVRAALTLVEHALMDRPSFDPTVDECHIRISCSDYSVLVLIGPLMHTLARVAPSVRIEVCPRSADPRRDLRSNAIDLIIEPEDVMAGIPLPSAGLFVDKWLACVWSGNPHVGNLLTLAKFLHLGHIVYSVPGGRTVNLADTYLSSIHIDRRVEFTVESFLLAPYLIENTELITLVLERAVPFLRRFADVRFLEPPIELAPIKQAMWWSPSRTTEPALAWVRGELLKVARDVGASTPVML